MYKKTLITLGVIISALYALGNANILLTFSNITMQSLQDRFSLVHFMSPGNNFVGSMFRLPSISMTGTTITLSGDTKTCTKQLRGLYFNSQRGQRLRPLDSETLSLLQDQNVSYNDLNINGGLYTTCENTNPYSVFGAITYNRGGVTGYLVAGTKYNYTTNKIIPNFAKSLQYFDNKVLIGYLYDSNGGIGFVGGSLTGHEALINYLSGGGSINSGFVYSGDDIVSNNTGWTITITSGNTAMETMRNMIIQGSVGLSKSINETERLSLLGNFQNKTIFYNGNDINSSTLINFAKQKEEELCKGKDKNRPLSTDETILCYENTDLTIDVTQSTYYLDKTIIVKSGSVILSGGMLGSSPALDLFIDKGNIYLPDTFTSETFNDQGFPSATDITSSGLYVKGNFIINGLIVGGLPGAETSFNHKFHFQGKMTTLNTPLEPSAERVDQVNTLLEGSYDNFIGLQKIFVRQCGLNTCGTGGVISTTPLVILNGNYPSNILQ